MDSTSGTGEAWGERNFAVADDEVYMLYSQLPFDMQFAMIIDCCHSGGIHRHGGARVRGLNPPDDIRHRELKWDQEADMWVERDFKPLNRQFSSQASVNDAFFGKEWQPLLGADAYAA